MEPSLSPILITLGLVFTIFAFIVESDAQREVKMAQWPPAHPRPPLPPAGTRPPPASPSPTSVLPQQSPPPQASTFLPPQQRPPPQPSTFLPPQQRPPPQPSTFLPPQQRPTPPPSPNRVNNKSSDNASHRRPPPQNKHRHSINTGKKIGLLFAGVAAILQIGVVGFLVFKRRQLLKINDRYDNYSS
ncbi:hypothetical protein AB3S75_003901 [Citrus x aurantiifolia]